MSDERREITVDRAAIAALLLAFEKAPLPGWSYHHAGHLAVFRSKLDQVASGLNGKPTAIDVTAVEYQLLCAKMAALDIGRVDWTVSTLKAIDSAARALAESRIVEEPGPEAKTEVE